MESGDGLRRLLSEFSIPLESQAALQLTTYLGLLERWNLRINLTSSTEWRVIGPMFREGIWASGFYPPGTVAHLDIGSGAGFPALLLKVLNPGIEMDLVESREKKSQFLETAAQVLGLPGVRVHAMRLSDYLRHGSENKRWGCISWKGLKLKADDLVRLQTRSREDTQFWMFHGQEPALESPAAIGQLLILVRKEPVPKRKESFLSIFRKSSKE